jgi:hypothetical protein
MNYRQTGPSSYTSIGTFSYSLDNNKYIDCLLDIISVSGNPNATIDSYTILMLWSSSNNHRLGRLEWLEGFDYDIQDIHGRTALSYAMSNSNLSFFEWLLKNGANPNKCSDCNDCVSRYTYYTNKTGIKLSDKFLLVLNKYYIYILKNVSYERKFDLLKRGIIDLSNLGLSVSNKIDYFRSSGESMYKLFGLLTKQEYENMTTSDLKKITFCKYDYVPEDAGAPLGLASSERAPQGMLGPERAPVSDTKRVHKPRVDSIRSFRLYILKHGLINNFFDDLRNTNIEILIQCVLNFNSINKLKVIDYVLQDRCPNEHFDISKLITRVSDKNINVFRKIVFWLIEKSGINLCDDIIRIVVDYAVGPDKHRLSKLAS